MEEKEIQDLDEGSVEEGWWQSVLADEETFAAGAVVIDPVEDPNNIDDQEKWSKLFDYLGDEAVISVKVFDFNRGGLLVKNDEIQGFIPISHLVDFPTDLPEGMRPKHFKKYMETDLNVKVIECDPKRGRVVLSERAAETAPGERQRLFKSLKMGDVCSGRVTNITEFGVFVDLGGLEGLVHVSELSWGRVLDPKTFINVGDEVEVMVLEIHQDKSRISLSLKQLLPNPWSTAAERYPEGKVVEGSITEVVKFGAFVKIEENMEGLIHITEMALEGDETPWSILAEDEVVDVEVVKIDCKRQRLSLRLVG